MPASRISLRISPGGEWRVNVSHSPSAPARTAISGEHETSALVVGGDGGPGEEPDFWGRDIQS